MVDSNLIALNRVAPIKVVFLGCLVSAFRPEKGWQAKRVREKLDAGAGFIQTRPCLELDVIRGYVSKLVYFPG